MTLYHIKTDGTPGVCTATPGNCPLGSSSVHTNSLEESQKIADRLNEIESSGFYEKVRLSTQNLYQNEEDEDTTYLTTKQITKLPTADLYVLSKTDEVLEEQYAPEMKKLGQIEVFLTEKLKEVNYLRSPEGKAAVMENYVSEFYKKNTPEGYPKVIKNVEFKNFEGKIVTKGTVTISLKEDLTWDTQYDYDNKEFQDTRLLLTDDFWDNPTVKQANDESYRIRQNILNTNIEENAKRSWRRTLERSETERAELEEALDLYSRELQPLRERRIIQKLAEQELQNRK